MIPGFEWITTKCAFVAAVFLALMFLLSVPFAAQKNGDFVHMWAGAKALLNNGGEHLYDPAVHQEIIQETRLSGKNLWTERTEKLGVFFYPPHAALLYAPFALLSVNDAQAAHAVVVWILTIASAFLLPIPANVRSRSTALALLFVSPAVFASFVLGQNGVSSLFIIALAAALERRGERFASGVALSLLVFKPTWLFAFGWHPLLMKKYRVTQGLIVGLITSTAITLPFTGVSAFRS